MFQSLHTRLLVSDFPACFRFYRDILDFVPTFGTEEDVYADFEIGSHGVALFARSLMAEAVGMLESTLAAAQDTIMLVLATDNVDETANTLRAKGVVLVTEPQDHPLWGIRTAHFRDPDRNLIEINSALLT